MRSYQGDRADTLEPGTSGRGPAPRSTARSNSAMCGSAMRMPNGLC